MKKIKKYSIQEFDFEIELEITPTGKIAVPVYIKFPESSLINSLTTNVNEVYFDYDINFMLPKSFITDWSLYCYEKLLSLIEAHIKNYNRILPSDLETYIAEYCLLASAILQKQFNKLLTEIEKINLFKHLLIELSNKFNVPIELKLL